MSVFHARQRTAAGPARKFYQISNSLLPNDVKSWQLDGDLEIIASHPNEK